MYIELIGATSAGKTTWATTLVRAGEGERVDVQMSDEFILRRLCLNWIPGDFARRRFVEFIALVVVCGVWWRHRAFLRFALKASFRGESSLLYRASVARIVIKKVGIRAIIRRLAHEDQMVIADNEGVLQAAHTLFVHKDGDADVDRLQRFMQLAPLPDVAIYLEQADSVLIERILRRGHGRLNNASAQQIEQFVRKAQQVFQHLACDPRIADRLLVIDASSGAPSSLNASPSERHSRFGQLLKVIQSTMQHTYSEQHDRPAKTSRRGRTIAIVGADATGKSTLVENMADWLSTDASVSRVHAGKPPTTWLTAPVNVLLPLGRQLMPHLRGHQASQSKPVAADRDDAESSDRSLLYAIRAVALAWDRRRLLLRAKRQSSQGRIIVCDRYPTEVVGAMDSPRLRIDPDARGWKGWIHNRLAKMELRLYREIPPPDLTLRLHVSLETARQRNAQREEQDADDYLERRHREQVPWSKPGTEHIIDIDTESGREQTTLAAKQAIAKVL